jgi:hypothetical protein
MSPSPSTIITAFVLENLPAQTVARRIELTRATAQLVASEDERRELNAIATGLERLERRQRKLTLRFKGGRRS